MKGIIKGIGNTESNIRPRQNPIDIVYTKVGFRTANLDQYFFSNNTDW